MKRTLLALLAAGALAAPAEAGVAIKPYGFVLANYTENWRRPNYADVPTEAVSESNTQPPNQNTSVFTARQTRLGLELSGTKGPLGSDLTGVVEGDFFGSRNTGAASLDVNTPSPRLRLAYLQAKRGDHAVLFGQDWVKAFSPLKPVSLLHVSISPLSNSGNLWNRLAQLRWDADWKLAAGWGLGTRLALVRSFSADEAGRTTGGVAGVTSSDLAGSGEFSGGPAYQALAELRRKVDGRTYLVGASMQYLRESFNSSVPPPAGSANYRVEGVLGAAHFVLPLHARLEVSGQGFYGRSDQNLQGLGTVYSDRGIVRTSQTRGGFVQAALKPADGWRCHAMAGFESIDELGLAAGAIFRNETVAANVLWDATAELTLGLEFGRIHSYYVSALSGDTKNLSFSAQYRF